VAPTPGNPATAATSAGVAGEEGEAGIRVVPAEAIDHLGGHAVVSAAGDPQKPLPVPGGEFGSGRASGGRAHAHQDEQPDLADRQVHQCRRQRVDPAAQPGVPGTCELLCSSNRGCGRRQ